MTYKQHIFKLCRKHNIKRRYVYHAGNSAALYNLRRILIPRHLNKAKNYAIALHEIAHVLNKWKNNPQQNWADRTNNVTKYQLRDERQAWYWAIEHAIEWTPRMEEYMCECINTYVRGHNYYLKNRKKKHGKTQTKRH